MAAGCFSEPVDPDPAGDTESGVTTDPQTSGNSDPTAAPSSGSLESTGSPGSTAAPSGSTEGSGSTSSSAPTCGNGELEGTEQCDGDDPHGAACLDDCTITCLESFRDCDEMPVSGCEIDTATDGDNCGACGHICASGVCEDSACAPASIAEGIGLGPTRITRVGDTFVFDESGFGRILRWDLAQEEVQELVSDDLTGSFRGFAVVNSSVFWLDRNLGAAQQLSLAGGPVDFMFAISDAGSPFASNTHLYYPTTVVEDGGAQISSLLRATHDAPNMTTAVASDVPGLMCQVTVAAGRIVWTGTDFENPVASIPAAGGPVLTHSVLSADACNRPLYGVGPSIYLYGRAVEGGPFGLISHNISTGGSSMVIQEPGPGALGDYYVSADGILADVGSEVRAYDLTGAAPHVVAHLPTSSNGRYLDDQVVMWTELEDNTWTLFVNERP